jgi:hypothetical protein
MTHNVTYIFRYTAIQQTIVYNLEIYYNLFIEFFLDFLNNL